jgi:hypothetical protein
LQYNFQAWEIWYNLDRDKCWVVMKGNLEQHPVAPAERKAVFPSDGEEGGREFSFAELSGFFGEEEVTIEILSNKGFHWTTPG